jgi:hypothetical protein
LKFAGDVAEPELQVFRVLRLEAVVAVQRAAEKSAGKNGAF